MIGGTTFDQVYQVKRTDGSTFVLKLQLSMKQGEKSILKTLKGKKFEHIIEVIAFEEKAHIVCIIMELGLSTNLKSLHNKNETCLQVYTLKYLRWLKDFHRDLKPDNFVIVKESKIKLIYFQTTKQTQNQYMASELFRTNEYDSSIDNWSLGMIFYEIFTNQTFFGERDLGEIIQIITSITQYQIDQFLQKSEEINHITKWQKELLQKMILFKQIYQTVVVVVQMPHH